MIDMSFDAAIFFGELGLEDVSTVEAMAVRPKVETPQYEYSLWDAAYVSQAPTYFT